MLNKTYLSLKKDDPQLFLYVFALSQKVNSLVVSLTIDRVPKLINIVWENHAISLSNQLAGPKSCTSFPVKANFSDVIEKIETIGPNYLAFFFLSFFEQYQIT